MGIEKNKPFRNVGVGSMYYAFAKDIEKFLYEETVHKAATVKSIGTTENSQSETIYASNAVYDNEESVSDIQLSVSVVAIKPLHRARMKGHKVVGGFVKKNINDEGTYFAYGIVYPKRNGHYTFEWYPKCKLTEATKDAQTKDDGGSNSQDKTLTIQAMAYNDEGDYSVEYDTELLEEGTIAMTEEEFFATPLLEIPNTQEGGIIDEQH